MNPVAIRTRTAVRITMDEIAPEVILCLRDSPARQLMASLWHCVKKRKTVKIEVREWSRITGLPTRDVEIHHPALRETGICRNDGTLHKDAASYLKLLAFSVIRVPKSSVKKPPPLGPGSGVAS